MKAITIAIPSLNAGRTLGATLESLRPLHDIAEIVLVDSYSEDDTLEIAQKYPIEIRTCPAGNMYKAINLGLVDARTDWVTYINADDCLYAASLMQRLKKLPQEVDLSYGSVDFIDQDGRFLRSWRPAKESSALRLYRAGYSAMLQQGTLMRRKLFQQLEGFNTNYRYVADADLWFRAFEAGAIAQRFGKETLAAFRLHPQQITLRLKNDMQAEHHAMCAAHGSLLSRRAVFQDLWAWRLENTSSYLLRWLRFYALGHRPVFCGSYDLP